MEKKTRAESKKLVLMPGDQKTQFEKRGKVFAIKSVV